MKTLQLSPFTHTHEYKSNSLSYWQGLHGASISLALVEMAKQTNHPITVITPDTHSANQLIEEISFFANGELPLLYFPDWETLAFDQFSPHQAIISERLHCLYQLPRLQQGIIITSVTTLMHRVAPSEFLEQQSFVLMVNDKLDIKSACQRLQQSGYRNVKQVMEHGEFAVRGALLDLYPMGSELPYRIELFDDEVETIRTFDPETQRSIEKITQINLLPAHEFPLDEESISLFRQNWRSQLNGNPLDSPIYQDVSQGLSPAGIEYYLPLFFQHTQTLFDYLPEKTFLFKLDSTHAQAEHFWHDVQQRYEQYRHDLTRPLLTPSQLFLSDHELFTEFKKFTQIQIQTNNNEKASGLYFNGLPAENFFIEHKAKEPLKTLRVFLEQNLNKRILFCAESAGRREALLELFKSIKLQPAIHENWPEFLESNETTNIIVSPLERGFALAKPDIVLITETQLFNQQIMQRRLRKQKGIDPETMIHDLTELKIGQAVVHLEHGVGLYQGLRTLQISGIDAEYLTLEYNGNDKLYVPVSSLHLISRYSSSDSTQVSLNKLGSSSWEKTKKKAAEKIRDVAAELLNIYAERHASTGFAFKQSDDYLTFSRAFHFEETPDQQAAIENVINDMSATHCMDRLVCGDVGFGKTEVAMRAAFVAAQNGKQVAVLVPTTLLAQQHYTNFSDRFADWPINIELISRFCSTKKQAQTLEKLKNGKIDIIIGTHKLLQSTIKFKDLGLVIVDEEHRFGVRHKEKLKALRTNIDILTLTATPIPRTLNMAFAGSRDLSIIATPPPGRLSIKTFIIQENVATLREAILRELARGGQIYYLHNHVQTINQTANKLQEWLPELRIGIAHGQMSELELEQIMSGFYHNRFNLLLCTTIIESGIDIPTANTIIIDNAHKLGLAQLHQLRGRVGRSHHQAYAYLVTPPHKALTSDAKKRLDAFGQLDDLGAGFTLATHDLEIRGTGELLGEEQSGHMHALGFELYMDLLQRAVKALKAGNTPSLEQPLQTYTEIDLHIPALIPETYLADVQLRLTLYKRIANATKHAELHELQVEMIDRFGLLPQPVKNLFEITELKLKAQKLGVRKIEANKKSGFLQFEANPPVNPGVIIRLIQQQPQQYKLQGPEKLSFTMPNVAAPERLQSVASLLEFLGNPK